jgi:hypothetical protein
MYKGEIDMKQDKLIRLENKINNDYKNIVVYIELLFELNVIDRIEFIKEYIESIFYNQNKQIS